MKLYRGLVFVPGNVPMTHVKMLHQQVCWQVLTWPVIDMKFLFKWSKQYFTNECSDNHLFSFLFIEKPLLALFNHIRVGSGVIDAK